MTSRLYPWRQIGNEAIEQEKWKFSTVIDTRIFRDSGIETNQFSNALATSVQASEKVDKEN